MELKRLNFGVFFALMGICLSNQIKAETTFYTVSGILNSLSFCISLFFERCYMIC